MPEEIQHQELNEENRRKLRRILHHQEQGTKLSSNCVVHFTPTFEILLKILKEGFRPNYNEELPIWRYEYNELRILMEVFGEAPTIIENILIPMVCFCDIPLKLINSHRKKYGTYGIALNKSWAKSSGLSPLLYVLKDTKTHYILHNAMALVSSIKRLPEYNEFGEAQNLCNKMNEFLEFVKPYLDENKQFKFYDEREWRYTPPSMIIVNPDDTTSYLKFQREDIIQVIVSSKKEKNIVLDLLNSEYGNFKPKLIKIKSIRKKTRF
jgi:hypothetical protein